MTTGVATMSAVVQDRYGSPDVLEVRDVAVPDPGAGEVLVAVRAAALNAADRHVMLGEPYIARAALGLRRPADTVQGRDVAGTVAAVGPGVTAFRPGDAVFGRPGSGPRSGGAFAQFVLARAEMLVAKPAELTFEQVAALPLAGNTALQCVRDAGRVAPGQQVLVHGASGGVGTFAIQIARALGAEVTAVCGPRHAGLARSLGARHVVDRTREDVTRLGVRYDVVLDLVPHHSLTALRRTMRPEGTLVLAGGGSGRWVAPLPMLLRARLLGLVLRRRRMVWVDETPDAGNLALLAGWAAAGTVTPVIDRVFPLADTADAMRHLLHGHPRGKVVVVP
jgi:NADPH:quinone reductase-like Zn-dependent oxidoreductase